MKAMLILAAAIVVAAANASASALGDPFAGVGGVAIGAEEAASLAGGDVTMTLNKERTKLKVKVDYEEKSSAGKSKVSYSYEVDAHNRVADTQKADFMPAGGATPEALKGKGKLTSRPESFPAGTWDVTSVKKRGDKFGPNMIGTDAVGSVEVFDAKGRRQGRYRDWGYAIHSNKDGFSRSKSWGCIIVREADNERLAGEINRDRARGGKQTLVVESERRTASRRSSSGRSMQDR